MDIEERLKKVEDDLAKYKEIGKSLIRENYVLKNKYEEKDHEIYWKYEALIEALKSEREKELAVARAAKDDEFQKLQEMQKERIQTLSLLNSNIKNEYVTIRLGDIISKLEKIACDWDIDIEVVDTKHFTKDYIGILDKEKLLNYYLNNESSNECICINISFSDSYITFYTTKNVFEKMPNGLSIFDCMSVYIHRVDYATIAINDYRKIMDLEITLPLAILYADDYFWLDDIYDDYDIYFRDVDITEDVPKIFIDAIKECIIDSECQRKRRK